MGKKAKDSAARTNRIIIIENEILSNNYNNYVQLILEFELYCTRYQYKSSIQKINSTYIEI